VGEFTHEAVRDWEERFTPLLAEHIRRKRKGKACRRWYVDETYLKVKGKSLGMIGSAPATAV
jgi:putative transposase